MSTECALFSCHREAETREVESCVLGAVCTGRALCLLRWALAGYSLPRVPPGSPDCIGVPGCCRERRPRRDAWLDSIPPKAEFIYKQVGYDFIPRSYRSLRGTYCEFFRWFPFHFLPSLTLKYNLCTEECGNVYYTAWRIVTNTLRKKQNISSPAHFQSAEGILCVLGLKAVKICCLLDK